MIDFGSITVSLEWAKKMKEAGWNEKTVFAFDHRFDYYELDDFYGFGAIFAPTAEEILRRLPNNFEGIPLRIQYEKDGSILVGYAYSKDGTQPMYRGDRDSLANAAAAMWCYLKENNLLLTS